MCEAGEGPDSMIALARLEGPLRHAIHHLKYGDRPQLAAHLVGATWRRGRIGPGVVVPVPLHPLRRRRRGYNQAELLAAELARLSGGAGPVAALHRGERGGRQVGRGGEARRSALVGAFTWSGAVIPEAVVIVDDVLTTGTTLLECARAARAAGVRRVDALAIALG